MGGQTAENQSPSTDSSNHTHSHSHSHSRRRHHHRHRKHRSKLYKAVRALFIVLLCLLAAGAAFVGYLTFHEYRPADRVKIEVVGNAKRTLSPGQDLKILTWNTGYGGLGDNADFFMDGGKMVKTADIARVTENITAIRDEVARIVPDAVLLQEVDFHSDRSYSIDEGRFYQAAFSSCDSASAYNYKAVYVPYPVPPIGHVESGLMTMSAYHIDSAERIQLPCPFKWPVSAVNLKRCLLVTRLPIEGSDHELALVNLHLEAYDNGEGKTAQAEMLRAFLQEEADKGNYVIAGGDFNQVFTNANAAKYEVTKGNWVPGKLDASKYSEGWQLLMDDSVPSCRSLEVPYKDADKEAFQYYLIDGFIVSANLAVTSCEGIDCGFVSSDHNPVLLTCRMIQ